jgi:serine/threonine-protein kinase
LRDPGDKGEPAVTGRDPRCGRVISGRYRIERPIARGGMGRVYLATQLQLGRPVAVKILNPEFQKSDPQFARRFCLEASISARLAHPNVVTVHDYGESEDGELFMAMELLKGRTLSSLIQSEAPLPPARIIHVALQIARALRDAHDKGVIHRDLKPGNVMLIEAGDDLDFVKVLDFGLVKLFVPEGQAVGLEGDGVELTRAGTLLGSPRYMSPEQIRGLSLDPRTDLYSLGVILFTMAAGKPPFTGTSSVDLIYKHVHHPVPALHEVAPGVDCPPELERIITRCLQKRRDDRYASMAEVIGALKEARYSITGASERPPPETGRIQPSHEIQRAVELERAAPVELDDPTQSEQAEVNAEVNQALERAASSSRAREAAFQDVMSVQPAAVAPRGSRALAALAALGVGLALAMAGLMIADRTRRAAPVANPPPVAAPVPAPPALAPEVSAPEPAPPPVSPAVPPAEVEEALPEEELAPEGDPPAGAEPRKRRSTKPRRATRVEAAAPQETPTTPPAAPAGRKAQRYRSNPY